MKIILSRKGFDSENGGMPSPIFPDGRMISLPIPTENIDKTSVKIGDLHIEDYNLPEILSDLNGISSDQLVHLDPDINHKIIKNRPVNWKGAFGQVGASQGHLYNNLIGKGDLFIYFGWFREIEKVDNHWIFKKDAPNLHAIYGWLLVDDVISVKLNAEDVLKKYPWLEKHPHLSGNWSNENTIYIGSQSLPPSINLKKSGFGVFDKIKDIQILTDTRQNNRTQWRLPSAFYPSEGKKPLTYNPIHNWEIEDENWVNLRAASKGQEFILDMDEYPDVYQWLAELFASE